MLSDQLYIFSTDRLNPRLFSVFKIRTVVKLHSPALTHDSRRKPAITRTRLPRVASPQACPPQTSPYMLDMRTALAFLLLASPAAAWEFSASPICTLTDTSEAGEMTVTYDPSITEYSITVTLPQGTWPDAQTFGMAFANDRPISIQTDRFTRSPDGRSLTVKDRGFGNVLNGLEFNSRAYAILGDLTVGFALDEINPAITAFRDCPEDNLA